MLKYLGHFFFFGMSQNTHLTDLSHNKQLDMLIYYKDTGTFS